MRPLRAILAVFFTLLFVASTNRCAIAAAFPGEVEEECCPNERAPEESERGLPCGKECAPCITLKTGVNLAALAPLTATAPMWTEDREFAELMRRLAIAAMEDAPAVPPDPAAIPPPPWCDVMVKALPVRGPSFVV